MWPFDQIDLVLSSNFLLGSLLAVGSSLMYSLGLILQKKAAYQQMGSRTGSDDPVPAWKDLVRRKIFWVGLVLFILKDPVETLSLNYTNGMEALPIGAAVVLFANGFFSYAVLYEHFVFNDIAAMCVCVISSAAMSHCLAVSAPGLSDKIPLNHIQALRSDPWANESFCIYGGIAGFLMISSILVARLTDMVKPFALTMLASLLWATFHLLSQVCITLISVYRMDGTWDADLYGSAAFWTIVVFCLSVFATCEGVRQLPCRYFLFGSVIGTDVATRVQALLFFRDWVFMPQFYLYTFSFAAVVSVFSVCIVAARGGVTLPSPGRKSLIDDEVKMHQTILHIMDEYKMRIPEAKCPGKLNLVDMQPDKFQGMRQQFPLIFFILIVTTPTALYLNGFRYHCFILCTIFSILQGWKMGAFIPLFTYVGIRKMERFSYANFKALYDQQELEARVDQIERSPHRPKWEHVVHFVVIPNYKETLEDLRMTLDSVAASKIASTQIGIVMAMEKGEEGAMEKAMGLKREYDGKFRYFVATCHPRVLTNGEHPEREVAGKSANAQWAARRFFAAVKGQSYPPQSKGTYSATGCLWCNPGSAAAPRDLEALDGEAKERRKKKEAEIAQESKEQEAALASALRGAGIKLDNVVLTVGDADSEFHPMYFEALTYYFIQGGGAENEPALRHLCVWQPPIIHMKNFLRQPWPVRIASVATSSHELANLADPNATRVAYSTYSLSGVLAEAMDGWDPEWMTEDWHTTLKVFLTTSARLRVMPIFFPILNNTPEGDTATQTLLARWEQGKRHAYGISEIVFLHEHMLRVLKATPGAAAKLLFAWRATFMWFKLMWIHAFIAVFPLFAPLNGMLIRFFRENEGDSGSSINTWTFLLNCIFQIVGLTSVVFTFIMSIFLFEAVKHRVDGIYTKVPDGESEGIYTPGLMVQWKNPLVNIFVFTLQSLLCLPFICIGFGICEWRAAWKTAWTKGGGFVYISAAMGSQNAKGGQCTIL